MKKPINKIIIVMLIIIPIIMGIAAAAKYTGYIDYDSIYNPKNYESNFDEGTVIAVMQPVEWCGTEQEYIDHGVFDDIDYSQINIISKCTEPSDDKLGDVILIQLTDPGREMVLAVIETLKSNQYVIYSMPNYRESPEGSGDVGTTDETYEYYLTDGVFEFEIKGNGTEILALYKNNMLVSSAIGSQIYVAGKDFDTLTAFYWSGLDTMKPIQNSISFMYQEVMDAPLKPVTEPLYGDVPSVYLTGDITDMSKQTRVTLGMKYVSETQTIEGYVSAKWQGNYSLNFDKKNYAIKVYKDENCKKKLKTKFKDWDSSNNYVLKANWIDSTQARNIVSARLYSTLPGSTMPNGSTGVIDGFPVRLYLNGEYRGLYTWNKPKKGWTFGLDNEDGSELLYSAEYGLGSCLFERRYSRDKWWELQFPDEHESADEMDRVTGFVAECTDEEFRNHIGEYMDFDSLLNFYVFSQIIMNIDGCGKNTNMATLDGNLWYIRPYDLDAVFGIEWYGWKLKNYTTDMSEEYMRNNVLWRKLEDNFPKEIYDRYILLRNNQLSEENVLMAFQSFMNEIGEEYYAEDLQRWSNQPSRNYMYNQIVNFVNTRYPYLDEYMEKFNS
ncbi:MAG: CotH kinase family protein [Oscillospiraceae bacterium]|nr:CotH kinase family protein [Oscillospiraceae bacterium]